MNVVFEIVCKSSLIEVEELHAQSGAAKRLIIIETTGKHRHESSASHFAWGLVGETVREHSEGSSNQVTGMSR